MGRPKAKVFPLPVSAAPNISFLPKKDYNNSSENSILTKYLPKIAAGKVND